MDKQDIINQIKYLKRLKRETKSKYKIIVKLAHQLKEDFDYLDGHLKHYESKLKEKSF